MECALHRGCVISPDTDAELLEHDVGLTASLWRRLQAYKKWYVTAYPDGGPTIFVNLTQEASYIPKPSELVGALLRGSTLWDLKQDTPVLPIEHFAIQGFAVDSESPLHARHFPWDFEVLGLLPHSQLRTVTGNGMHLAAVSSALAFALAAVQAK